jgi:hypothetical protein
VVLGGLGFFGGAAAGLLRSKGAKPVLASRRPQAQLRVDAEDPASIRAALRPGDVVLDAAGPFQRRTTTLVEAAVEIGFDVVDLSEDLSFAERVLALRARIEHAGVRVLTACSSVSAISAAAVRRSRIAAPIRVDVFLAPASRFTARPATGAALLASVGKPIRVWRDGCLADAVGWSESRVFPFPPPVGRVRGWLMESADALLLPAAWPSIRTVGFWVDTHAPGTNALFAAAARRPLLRRLLERGQPLGLALARRFGARASTLSFEITGAQGPSVRIALAARERGYLAPVVPAVLAARSIAEGRFEPRGLVPVDRQVDPDEAFRELRSLGLEALEG